MPVGPGEAAEGSSKSERDSVEEGYDDGWGPVVGERRGRERKKKRERGWAGLGRKQRKRGKEDMGRGKKNGLAGQEGKRKEKGENGKIKRKRCFPLPRK